MSRTNKALKLPKDRRQTNHGRRAALARPHQRQLAALDELGDELSQRQCRGAGGGGGGDVRLDCS